LKKRWTFTKKGYKPRCPPRKDDRLSKTDVTDGYLSGEGGDLVSRTEGESGIWKK
jgi:hypothetical protein